MIEEGGQTDCGPCNGKDHNDGFILMSSNIKGTKPISVRDYEKSHYI